MQEWGQISQRELPIYPVWIVKGSFLLLVARLISWRQCECVSGVVGGGEIHWIYFPEEIWASRRVSVHFQWPMWVTGGSVSCIKRVEFVCRGFCSSLWPVEVKEEYWQSFASKRQEFYVILSFLKNNKTLICKTGFPTVGFFQGQFVQKYRCLLFVCDIFSVLVI